MSEDEDRNKDGEGVVSTSIASYPAIDRALRILSNRLGLNQSKEQMNITEKDELLENRNESEDERENGRYGVMDEFSGGGESSTNFQRQHQFDHIVHEDDSSDSLEGHFITMDCTAIKCVAPTQDLNGDHEGKVSVLNGLSTLAHKKHRHLQLGRQEEKCASLILTKQAKVLRNALDWCRVWSIKSKFFWLIIQYVRRRTKKRAFFNTISSQVFTNIKYEHKFSVSMKENCRNRFGKLRVSELYSNWRIKRACLAQWLRYMAYN